MTDLYLFRQKLDSFFEILGKHENDISYSVGFVLSRSPAFLRLFLRHIDIKTKFDPELIKVKLQQHERDKGFTDFEIEQEGEFSVIVEAKRGWNYPSRQQLDKYSSRKSFKTSSVKTKKLVVLTESSNTFTTAHFHIKRSNSYKVTVISWKEMWTLARQARRDGGNYQKRLLEELIEYLGKIMTLQNIYSNKVYVVSLKYHGERNWGISWIDIVKERRRYFHPVGGSGWPNEPPNYIAFRYYGRLQSIHHIDNYEVFTNPHKVFKEIPSAKWGPHFLYHLGEPIIPVKEIRTGNIFRSGRVWAMLDLLLTCDTIAEARDKTKKREQELKQ